MQKTISSKKIISKRLNPSSKNLNNLSKDLVKSGKPISNKELTSFLNKAEKTEVIGLNDFINDMKAKYQYAQKI